MWCVSFSSSHKKTSKLSNIILHQFEGLHKLWDTPQLLEIWEDSVRATHHFLSDAEVNQIKKYVPQALTGVKHLIVAENEIGIPVAVMGTQDHRLEMLFISSKERGKGIGK